MKNIILLFSVFLLSTIIISADFNEQNYTFFYDKCSHKVINKDYDYIEKFGENFCSFLISDKGELFVLENTENDLGIEKFSDEITNYIKTKYYRGERISINAELLEERNLNNLGFKIGDKDFITSKTAKIGKIVFGSDVILQDYKALGQKCDFDSFIPKCKDKDFQDLVNKIDSSYNPLFLTKEQLVTKKIQDLQKEVEKNQNIKTKIGDLKVKYEKEEKISFTIEYILYKMTLYNSIVESVIEDKNFEESLVKKELKGTFIKELLNNFTVRQNDFYTYFYYKEKLLHTVENNIETLSIKTREQNKNSLGDKDFVKQKIIDEYKANFLESSKDEIIYLSRINGDFGYLIDLKTFKKFKMSGVITKAEKGKKGYYLLTFGSRIDLYNGKKFQNIIESSEGKIVNNFELLSGGIIQITFQNNNGEKVTEKYDINNL